MYDAGRDLHYPKPVLRGWLHLVWFEASIVLGTLLVATIAHGALELTAAAIYTAAMVGLFGISALYHLGHWQAATRRVLQRLDHAMIFLLIAGTATPAFLLAAPERLRAGWSSLPVGAHPGRHRRAPGLDAGTRTAGGGRLPRSGLDGRDGSAGGVDQRQDPRRGVAAGWRPALHGRRGVLPPPPAGPVPAVFGYHEVFHTCVCAAAACQYIAIAFFIV